LKYASVRPTYYAARLYVAHYAEKENCDYKFKIAIQLLGDFHYTVGRYIKNKNAKPTRENQNKI